MDARQLSPFSVDDYEASTQAPALSPFSVEDYKPESLSPFSVMDEEPSLAETPEPVSQSFQTPGLKTPEEARVEQLAKAQAQVDAAKADHGMFDWIFDVPPVMKSSGYDVNAATDLGREVVTSMVLGDDSNLDKAEKHRKAMSEINQEVMANAKGPLGGTLLPRTVSFMAQMGAQAAKAWDAALAGAGAGALIGAKAGAAAFLPVGASIPAGVTGGGLGLAAGATLGFTAGTAREWYYQGVGDFYAEFKKVVDKDEARIAAVVGAVPYAAVEFISGWIPGIRGLASFKPVVSASIRKTALSVAWNHLKVAGAEATEESLQQAIQDGMQNWAVDLQNQTKGTELEALTGSEMFQRALSAFTESFMPILLGGGLLNAKGSISAVRESKALRQGEQGPQVGQANNGEPGAQAAVLSEATMKKVRERETANPDLAKRREAAAQADVAVAQGGTGGTQYKWLAKEAELSSETGENITVEIEDAEVSQERKEIAYATRMMLEEMTGKPVVFIQSSTTSESGSELFNPGMHSPNAIWLNIADPTKSVARTGGHEWGHAVGAWAVKESKEGRGEHLAVINETVAALKATPHWGAFESKMKNFGYKPGQELDNESTAMVFATLWEDEAAMEQILKTNQPLFERIWNMVKEFFGNLANLGGEAIGQTQPMNFVNPGANQIDSFEASSLQTALGEKYKDIMARMVKVAQASVASQKLAQKMQEEMKIPPATLLRDRIEETKTERKAAKEEGREARLSAPSSDRWAYEMNTVDAMVRVNKEFGRPELQRVYEAWSKDNEKRKITPEIEAENVESVARMMMADDPDIQQYSPMRKSPAPVSQAREGKTEARLSAAVPRTVSDLIEADLYSPKAVETQKSWIVRKAPNVTANANVWSVVDPDTGQEIYRGTRSESDEYAKSNVLEFKTELIDENAKGSPVILRRGLFGPGSESYGELTGRFKDDAGGMLAQVKLLDGRIRYAPVKAIVLESAVELDNPETAALQAKSPPRLDLRKPVSQASLSAPVVIPPELEPKYSVKLSPKQRKTMLAEVREALEKIRGPRLAEALSDYENTKDKIIIALHSGLVKLEPRDAPLNNIMRMLESGKAVKDWLAFYKGEVSKRETAAKEAARTARETATAQRREAAALAAQERELPKVRKTLEKGGTVIVRGNKKAGTYKQRMVINYQGENADYWFSDGKRISKKAFSHPQQVPTPHMTTIRGRGKTWRVVQVPVSKLTSDGKFYYFTPSKTVDKMKRGEPIRGEIGNWLISSAPIKPGAITEKDMAWVNSQFADAEILAKRIGHYARGKMDPSLVSRVDLASIQESITEHALNVAAYDAAVVSGIPARIKEARLQRLRDLAEELRQNSDPRAKSLTIANPALIQELGEEKLADIPEESLRFRLAFIETVASRIPGYIKDEFQRLGSSVEYVEETRGEGAGTAIGQELSAEQFKRDQADQRAVETVREKVAAKRAAQPKNDAANLLSELAVYAEAVGMTLGTDVNPETGKTYDREFVESFDDRPKMKEAIEKKLAEARGVEPARLSAAFKGMDQMEPEPGFPHGRFRLEFAGTGQGQAQGHGLYFGQRKETGENYLPEPIYNEEEVFASRKEAEDFVARQENPEERKIDGQADEWWVYRLDKDASSLYEVDIPDDVIPKLLDWDKPLDEQSPHVKVILRKIRDLEPRLRTWFTARATGEDLYRTLAEADAETGEGGKQAASEFLNRAGIPGNKYLDQGSRQPPPGNAQAEIAYLAKKRRGDLTHNYVIWDQPTLDRISVLARNGERMDQMRETQAQLSATVHVADRELAVAKHYGFSSFNAMVKGGRKMSMKRAKEEAVKILKSGLEIRNADRFTAVAEVLKQRIAEMDTVDEAALRILKRMQDAWGKSQVEGGDGKGFLADVARTLGTRKPASDDQVNLRSFMGLLGGLQPLSALQSKSRKIPPTKGELELAKIAAKNQMGTVEGIVTKAYIKKYGDTQAARRMAAEVVQSIWRDVGMPTDMVRANPKTNGIDVESTEYQARLRHALEARLAGWEEKAVEWWKSMGLLSGIATIFQNPVSNAARQLYEYGPKQFLADVIMGKGPVNSLRAIGSNLSLRMMGTMARRARQIAKIAFDNEIIVLGRVTPTGVVEGTRLDPGSAQHAIPGKAGRVIRLPFRALSWGDEYTKAMDMQINLSMQYFHASRAGMDLTTGTQVAPFTPTGKQTEEFMEWAFRNMQTPLAQEALQQAIYHAWQNVNKYAAPFAALRSAVPHKLGHFIIPFTNTPMNIFTQSLKMTPLGIVNMGKVAIRNAINRKHNPQLERYFLNFSNKEFASDLAEQMIAFGITGLLYSMLHGDDDDKEWLPYITGGQPAYKIEPGKGGFMRREAMPPMHIRVGNKMYDYSRIEPFATILPVVLDFLQAHKDAKNGEDGGKALASAFASVGVALSDKTFVGGVGDIVQAIENPEALATWASNFTASWMPNIARQTLKALDPYARDLTPKGQRYSREWAVSTAQKTGYRVLPIPAMLGKHAPAPQWDMWGKPIRTTNEENPSTDLMYRLLGLTGLKIKITKDQELNRMILNWNDHARFEGARRRGDPAVFAKRYFDKPEKYMEIGRDRAGNPINHYFTESEYQEYIRTSGQIALDRASRMSFNYENPTVRDMKRLEDVIGMSRRIARNRLKRKLNRE